MRPLPWAGLASSLLVAALVAALFGAAGTLGWWTGWLYLAVLGAGLFLHRAYVARRLPELLARRTRIGPGTRPWDKAWLAIFWPLMLLAPLAAGLELRRGRAPLPAWAWLAGAAALGAGLAISARAMGENRFFEGTVRLQPGQVVVETGPYRRLRHPGYLGLALWALATPLLLRSRWALPPALAAAAWVVLRTALEDAFLRRELPGYAAYASRVQRRLVPGVW